MTARKIVAVFDTHEAAERARDSLVDLGLEADRISISDRDSSEFRTETKEARGGFWAHVKALFMPDSDRETLEESMRRGGCVLMATVDDTRTDEAIARLEAAGAIDLDERASEWRTAGWRGGTPAEASSTVASAEREPAAASLATEPAASARGESEAIPVVEEQLRVGKREVNRGSVRVRSYMVEEPVQETVHLREERVHVERRPVDEPLRPVVKGSPDDLMQERTVEVPEISEQAVVGKEARVTEEVVITKEAEERDERIDDTVRRTEVEVEDGRGKRVPKGEGSRDPARPTRS
jgi:uncharacterized protein (TIGR02271 family)